MRKKCCKPSFSKGKRRNYIPVASFTVNEWIAWQVKFEINNIDVVLITLKSIEIGMVSR